VLQIELCVHGLRNEAFCDSFHGNAFFLKKAPNKEQVIREAAAKLSVQSDLPAATIVAALLKREALGSTAMGDGVDVDRLLPQILGAF